MPHHHELRGHYGVHRERRCRVPGRRGGHRSGCRHSGRCARSNAAGASVTVVCFPLGRKPNRDRGMKEAGNLLDRQYFCRTGDATPMFTDAVFERPFRRPHTAYETIRPAVLKTSKFEAACKQAGSVWFHPSPLTALPAPAAMLVVPPAIRGRCFRGRRGRRAECGQGVPCEGRGRGWGAWWLWKAGTRRSSARRRPACDWKWAQLGSFSGKRVRPKVQFGQEICPKCTTLDKILVHIQTLEGPVGERFVNPKPKI
jgi:hypothetical protein